MKCPKCQYISFDSKERCRNCGYEFALAVEGSGFDLPIQTGHEAIGPLGDFDLESGGRIRRTPAGLQADKGLAEFGPTPPRPITSSFDLPLFKERRVQEDAPLVAPPVSPRAPLSVRRSSPTPVPPRPPNREVSADSVLDLQPAVPAARAVALPVTVPAEPDRNATGLAAGIGARLAASLVDAVILGTIGLAVLYLTLKICGLPFARIAAIPIVPFGAFILLIASGYLTVFTAAGGQTIGKMAAGIKVVSMGVDSLRVPLAHSVLRAAAFLVSALPAGLGFLPALLGEDRRAIHDRLADTRVVKA